MKTGQAAQAEVAEAVRVAFEPNPQAELTILRGSGGWETSVTVTRRSPWCAAHLEGLRVVLAPGAGTLAPSHAPGLREEVMIASAGWGCCTACHPEAGFDLARAQAEAERLAALRT